MALAFRTSARRGRALGFAGASLLLHALVWCALRDTRPPAPPPGPAAIEVDFEVMRSPQSLPTQAPAAPTARKALPKSASNAGPRRPPSRVAPARARRAGSAAANAPAIRASAATEAAGAPLASERGDSDSSRASAAPLRVRSPPPDAAASAQAQPSAIPSPAVLGASAPESGTSTPDRAAPHDSLPVPSTFALSPQRAADTLRDALPAPSEICRPPAAGPDACESEPGVDAAQASRALSRSLRQAANAHPYLTARQPPELQHDSDGGYRYDGHVFTAKIHNDGSVQFVDGGPLGVDGPGHVGVSVRGHFDLSDAIEHGLLGKELYSAEKRWFLEQTAALRDQLAQAARAREAMHARRALERELERIAAATSLNRAQKHARVLQLWEDCGEDADTQRARRIVEAFVRSRMPQESALGFSREELAAFNRARAGMQPFEPYVAAPGAAEAAAAGAPG